MQPKSLNSMGKEIEPTKKKNTRQGEFVDFLEQT